LITARPRVELGGMQDVPTSQIEDEVATLAAQIAVTTGRFIELLAELERRGHYGAQGFQSLAHWLSWRCGLDLRTAREHVRVAEALTSLPTTASALKEGVISYSKARAITRVARPETEEKLVEMAQNATAVQLDRIVSTLRRADPPSEKDTSERIQQRRDVSYHYDQNGMLCLRARLAPEEGALLVRALESARDALSAEKLPHSNPDALALVADRSLSETAAARSGSDRVLVMVHVDQEVLADPTADGQSCLEDGPAIPAGVCQRLACDASVVTVTHTDDGEATLSRRRRAVSRALARALRLRDGNLCTFPACTHRIVDAHHVKHWIQGGPTTLANLTLLCRTHHVLVHECGFRVELDEKGIPTYYGPDGRAIPRAPRAVPGPLPDMAVGPESLAAGTEDPLDIDAIVAAFH
jgi:hypothetical protein